MTFLPIVARELRVTARRRATYWMRLVLALLATCIGSGIFAVTMGFLSPQQTGHFIFQALAGLLVLYSLGYGRRATADCLSVEKREGTLGLLFLTDLKGHDVVLGKLAATSLSGFYAFLGVSPVLTVCLLLGGITSGEVGRMLLVLVDAFLLSLAIGMLGSALTRDFRRAMAANFLLLLLFVGLLPAAGAALQLALPSTGFLPGFYYACPVYTYYLAFDAHYKIDPPGFWISAITILSLTWLLLFVAALVVPRTWQERASRAKRNRWRELWHAWSYGEPSKRPAFRKRLLDVNAFYWLASRARLKSVHVWTFLGGLALWWLVGWLTSGALWLDDAQFVLTAVLLNFAFKVWVVIEAGQELADDQKSGAVELLLSVPLSVQDILRGQLLALRRQFFWPVQVVIATGLLFMAAIYSRSPSWQVLLSGVAGIVMFVLDLMALVWVAMLRGLVARNHNQATISTILRVLVLPWVLFGLVMAVTSLFFAFGPGPGWTPGWGLELGLWFGLGLAVDLAFGVTAWWRLHHQFRQIALRRFEPAPLRKAQTRKPKRVLPDFAGRQRDGGRAAGEVPRERKRKRLPFVLAGLLLLLIGGWLLVFRGPANAPALEIRLSSRQGPLQVFPASGGVFLILPDRTLWRWGQTEPGLSARAAIPEQVGTDSNWIKALTAGGHCVGLRADGTVWEWGSRRQHPVSEPVPGPPGHDWQGIAVSGGHTVALRQDGTVWEWGAQPGVSVGLPGSFPNAQQSNLLQVGTNEDWIDVSCTWGGSLGLRRDGTIWVWGQALFFSRAGAASSKNYVAATRICRDTNWSSFASGLSPQAWSRSGELWDLLERPADPDVPASACCRLVLSNSAPGRAVVGFTGSPKVFELRPDGTLWQKDYAFRAWSAAGNQKWRKVGKRSDWVSLWGGGGTVLGLTADGTLWTWGVDPGKEPRPNFSSRLRTAQARFRGLVGPGPAGMQFGGSLPVQKEPRPLLHMTWVP